MPKGNYSDEWWDEVEDASRFQRSVFAEFGDLGTPDPTHWDRYDVHIDSDGHVSATITDDDGQEWTLNDDGVDFDDDDWKWVWDIWDWIDESGYDIDEDSHYKEK